MPPGKKPDSLKHVQIVVLKGRPEWRDWLAAFAESQHESITYLIEFALKRWAERTRADRPRLGVKAPPARTVYNPRVLHVRPARSGPPKVDGTGRMTVHSYQGLSGYRAWVRDAAARAKLTVAVLVEEALRQLAEEVGFEGPPRR